jgi:hypothetical protein
MDMAWWVAVAASTSTAGCRDDFGRVMSADGAAAAVLRLVDGCGIDADDVAMVRSGDKYSMSG